MIHIKRIWVETIEDSAYLKGAIHLDKGDEQAWLDGIKTFLPDLYNRRLPLPLDQDGNFIMWYKVPKDYSQYLCAERADAFVVACLYFSMAAGIDIISDIPLTSCLLYQLNEQQIPLLCNEKSGFKRVSIHAPVASELEKSAEFVGTGISCGIDSFCTIMLGLKDSLPKDNRLTHLAVFNTGSLNFYGYENISSLETWREETEKELAYHIQQGNIVAHKLGLSFISIDTNIPDLYQGAFLLSHTYRNLSCILATQKMWLTYYYASTGEGVIFKPSLTVDTGLYDVSTISNISLYHLKMYTSAFEVTRMQKLEMIADHPVVQEHLNVCSHGKVNCGRCTKCKRTLLNLDILGKLDDFKHAFPDMAYYKKNRCKLLTTSVREAKRSNLFGYEMKIFAEEHGFKYGWTSDLLHLTYLLRQLRIFIIHLLSKK